ncbi:TetR/AcrR family transcriptional regulator [Vampirovibrio sp.]|uniref:TetR/AcrR family transcriptional regulator n=1 Tax=Vampirovibrio sp. TaxID=2717857 RepID=UPI0035949016
MTPQPPDPKATTGKPRPVDARGEILHHAKILFREKGFSSVSMNDLVNVVGLTKPTIYYHFTDKETLFSEVLVEMMRHGSEMLVAGVKRCKGCREKLYKMAEGYFRFSPTSLSTMVRDSSQHLTEAHLKKVMEAHQFYLLKPVESIFEEGIQAGEIKATEDPQKLAFYFVSWIDTMTTLKAAYEGRSFETRKNAETMVNIFLHGVAPPVSNGGLSPSGTNGGLAQSPEETA